MRTQAEGMLTSADLALALGVDTELRQAAHGDVPHSIGCEACDRMWDALKVWFAAHAFGPEDADEMEGQ